LPPSSFLVPCIVIDLELVLFDYLMPVSILVSLTSLFFLC